MFKLRVYADRQHYTEANRKSLNDILKAVWNDAPIEERRRVYGVRVDCFEFVDSPDAADLHLLPMKWQHYVETNRVGEALEALATARKSRRPIAVFSVSDFEANFPGSAADGVHLFQASAYRSRRIAGNHAYPAFFADPLEGREVDVHSKPPRPLVGFCGQAGASVLRHAARFGRTHLNRALWKLGRLQWEPPPLEHTWFRQRVIDKFDQSAALDTRFVLRTHYRAGISESADRESTVALSRREFIENVAGTDYTLCMRGGGNFSVRFYEALAMGRIPIFIDTDCVVPYDDQVPWREIIPWVDASQLDQADRIVAEFHARLSPHEFRQRQLECRRLWVERLTPDGFYSHFVEHFPEIQV